MGRADGLAPSVKGAPQQVKDGVLIWYGVAALQLVTGILQLVLSLTDRRTLTRQVTEQTKDMDLPGDASIHTLVTGYAILQFLLTLLSAVVAVWLISRVGRRVPLPLLPHPRHRLPGADGSDADLRRRP